MNFISSPVFTWVILPILIFLARILDVSLGTLRIVFVSRGNRLLAPLLGFFEVLVWITALGKIMENLSNPVTYLAYAAGFAAGNYIGIIIEEKIAAGNYIIRIITRTDAHSLAEALRQAGYTVTYQDAEGNRGPVAILYSIIKRSDTSHFVEIINRYNPQAFYTIEDVRFVNSEFIPVRPRRRFGTFRKGK